MTGGTVRHFALSIEGAPDLGDQVEVAGNPRIVARFVCRDKRAKDSEQSGRVRRFWEGWLAQVSFPLDVLRPASMAMPMMILSVPQDESPARLAFASHKGKSRHENCSSARSILGDGNLYKVNQGVEESARPGVVA